MAAIDLGPFLGTGLGRVSILSGKDRGVDLRRKLDLEALDARDEIVELRVPNDLRRVTPSFVLGLFSATFAKLAASSDQDQVKVKFFDRYRLENTPNASRIKGQITETIDDFFAARSALDDMGRDFAVR